MCIADSGSLGLWVFNVGVMPKTVYGAFRLVGPRDLNEDKRIVYIGLYDDAYKKS